MFAGLLIAAALVAPEWNDVHVNSLNRLPARCDSMPLASVSDALSSDEPETPYVKTLDGRWKYHWAGCPAQRPVAFWKPDYDDTCWEEIDVPSCVETRGYGMPMYLAHGYPGLPTPLKAGVLDPDYNPVSSYRMRFTVPPAWNGRRVVIRFEGVYSAYYVWVNGQRIGYAEDAKLPSEFDVTPYLKQENLLCVEVYRWSDGAYLEDQDMIRYSGIFRSVCLYAEPRDAIRDFGVTTEIAADFSRVTVKTDGPNPRLFDASGKEVPLTVENPRLWSAEDPYLYTLVVSNGEDIRSCKVGVRKVERVGNTVHFNGRPIKYRGVNRHEHSPMNGRSVSRAEMLQDILLMKRHNIDTVRTCHYPDDPYWYKLCDRYGIYLIAEANVESHGMGQDEKTGLGYKPEWKAPIVERNVNHVKNYRNHPSIFMWSLGNEAGGGPAFREAAARIREMDPTRLLHYEQENALADVDSRMYQPVPWILERGKLGDGKQDKIGDARGRRHDQSANKPFICCEYAHAMGNAMGNFRDYWDAFYTSESLIGGCVWDWIDQSLWKACDRLGPDGKRIRYLAYGGDWDDLPNDANVCQNGVIGALREVTPKLLEMKHVHRQLVVRKVGDGLELENRFGFTHADAFSGCWELLRDGVAVRRGTVIVPHLAPFARAMLDLPDAWQAVQETRAKGSGELFLNISFALKGDNLWAKAGHVIAQDQISLGGTWVSDIPAVRASRTEVAEDAASITVSAGTTKAVFSKSTATLMRLEMGGVKVLEDLDGIVAGPRLTAIRAFADNDTSLSPGRSISIPFFNAGLSRLAYHMPTVRAVRRGEDVAVVCSLNVDGTKSAGWSHEAEWIFSADGKVVVKNHAMPHGKMPELPRLGLSWKLDGALENVEWYGRGPHENYIDRCASAFVGRYVSTVTEQYVDYVRPQENGAKGDVRWVAFKDAHGRGVRFSCDRPLFFRALHFDWEDLEFARHHRYEKRIYNPKPPRREICLDLDVEQRGLGGASCGTKTLPEYAFPAKEERWTLTLVGLH